MTADDDHEGKAPIENNNSSGNMNKHFGGIAIVGINMLILVTYTIACKLVSNISSLALDAFIIGLQVLVCIVMAIVKRSGVWLLSALLVLVIGFSTCVGIERIS